MFKFSFLQKIYIRTNEHIQTGVTLNGVGSPSLAKLTKIAYPKSHVKTPATLSKMAKVKSNNISNVIPYVIEATKEDIHGIGFTSDLWSSRDGHSCQPLKRAG